MINLFSLSAISYLRPFLDFGGFNYTHALCVFSPHHLLFPEESLSQAIERAAVEA